MVLAYLTKCFCPGSRHLQGYIQTHPTRLLISFAVVRTSAYLLITELASWSPRAAFSCSSCAALEAGRARCHDRGPPSRRRVVGKASTWSFRAALMHVGPARTWRTGVLSSVPSCVKIPRRIEALGGSTPGESRPCSRTNLSRERNGGDLNLQMRWAVLSAPSHAMLTPSSMAWPLVSSEPEMQM